jgi:hypothetical protein
MTEVDIVIDERLPVVADGTGKLLASRPSADGELWACYLEKAMAVHSGGWDKIHGRSNLLQIYLNCGTWPFELSFYFHTLCLRLSLFCILKS